ALDRKKVNEVIDAAIENAKGLMLIFFLLMVAYAMGEVFMATGVGASIIGLSMKLGITGKSVATVALILTAVLSTATGTSWGTFAACVPVFLWLSHITGGSPVLTVAAIAGGSCFGDNIGLISDTTVLSSGIQNVEVMDRVRHQGVWSLICLVVSAVLFYLVSASMGLESTASDATKAVAAIPAEIWETLKVKRPSAIALLNQVQSGVPIYMVIPLVLVLGMAVYGVSTMPCLIIGLFSALVFGLIAGTIESVSSYLDLVLKGFADAGSWSVAMSMWTGAFGGIMKLMNAFDPIAKFVLSTARNVRTLIFNNGILCLITNAALGDCTGQIVTVGPVIKEIVEENVVGSEKDLYTLRLRNATMSDAFGVLGSQLIPWHGYMIFYTGLAMAVYPLYEFTPMGIIAHNYLSIIAVFSMLFLTITGFDRFIPMFKLPSEPDVQLKKNIKPAN
ncbi:MAG: Na+/H+ antiporter NhaC family protein, partial [Synergistaceae bacterium]